MTDDKDFKRLVRARMAKTGESYAAARAKLRGPSFPDRVLTRQGLERLGDHLADRYGIAVTRLTPLDVGVLRVDRGDGPAWVARVFAAERPTAQAERDAAVLRLVAEHGLPAERLAPVDEPVSTLAGQAVLVTEFVPGDNARTDDRPETHYRLGETIGRLHGLAAPTGWGQAGSWHHLSLAGGGREADLTALEGLLDPSPLRDEVERADRGTGLPTALIHPDPCGANAVLAADGPVLVDWTGAGVGPRLVSFANLLAGASRLAPVDAAVAGYRRAGGSLTDAELDRLADAVYAFRLLLEGWMTLVHGETTDQAMASLTTWRERAGNLARRAREAFAADLETLPDFPPDHSPDAVDPNQATLF